MTVAAFDIEGKIPIKALEKEFQNYTMPNGEKI